MGTILNTRQMREFGLTATQAAVLGENTHRCPGCLRPFTEDRRPNIDHRHRSGLIRGLLCANCNTIVGGLHDDAGLLRRLSDYLSDPPAVHLIGHHYKPNSLGAAGHFREDQS